MSNIDEFFLSVKNAYAKSGGINWPGRGKQIGNSFIKLASMNQLNLINEIRQQKSLKQTAELFWSTTQIRYILTGEFIVGLKRCEKEDHIIKREQIIDGVEYLLELLKNKTITDPFCLKGHNNTFKPDQIEKIFQKTKWTTENKTLVKQAIVASSSVAWAFGYDTYFANFMEIHGPYDLPQAQQMMVREYKFDTIKEVWPDAPPLPEMLRLYLIYNNEDITIDWELHTETQKGMQLEKYYAAFLINGVEAPVDPTELEKLSNRFTGYAAQQVEKVNALSVSDKVRKGAQLVYLQTKMLADALGKDWQPNSEVEKQIQTEGESNWNAKPTPQKPKPPFEESIKIFDPREP